MSGRLMKHSQTLLAKNSTSPKLLAVHAYVEWTGGKYDKAQKVYQVALSSLKQSRSPNLVYLWWGAAELNWLRSKNTEALKFVLQAAEQLEEPSNINILRAKHRLQEQIQASFSDWKI